MSLYLREKLSFPVVGWFCSFVKNIATVHTMRQFGSKFTYSLINSAKTKGLWILKQSVTLTIG